MLVPFVAKLWESGDAASKEADALKTVEGATKALDDATGRLHKSKQQQIDDSNRASQALLKEALATRTLLQAQADSIAKQANDPLTQAAGGVGAAGAINATWIARNSAEIKRLQDSLGGVGFTAAVDRATAATSKAAKATQDYEAYLARVQAAWNRSGKTAADQAIAERLVEEALRRRDAATKAATGSTDALSDAHGRMAGAVNAVQRAEAQLGIVRATTAAALKAHTITEAERTAQIGAAVRAVNEARAAQQAHTLAVRDGVKADNEAIAAAKVRASLEEDRIFEHGKALAEAQDHVSKPIDVDDTLKKNLEMLAKWVEVRGTVAQMNDEMARQTKLLDDTVKSADKLAESFGRVGAGIEGAIALLVDYRASQKSAEDEHSKRIATAGAREADLAAENARYARETARLQVGAYADMAHAAQDFFKKGSTGYKLLGDAEKVFRLAQFAMSVQAVAHDLAETGSKLATSAARTAAGAVEAVVNAIKSLPFPLNIAAGAATIGALAGIGVGIAGSFGGGHNNLPASNTGTGTVLGDTSAKSDSIQRAIETLNDTDVLTAGYSAQMAASLKSIESQIGGLSSLLVRTGNINASTNVSQGFETNAIGSILKATVPIFGGVLASLFGTKTSVIGSGISANAQSVGDILNGGFDASYYSDVERKKKFLGLTTSTKYSTQTTGADSEIEQQFGLILKGFYDTIAAAAPALGDATGAIEDRLSSFVVSIGKIDLQGLSGTEIQDKLTAVFGAAADQMAQAGFPGLEKFQAVGEGYFETLARVASTVETVTSSLQELGLATQSIGIDASMGIAGKFDSASDYQSAAQAYFQGFYTDAEQAAAKTAQLSQAFTVLGMSMPDSIASFRSLVEAQDLTTDAGQSAYAMLLKLAPAFADVVNAGTGATNAATSAADIARERADLEKQLLNLQGDQNAIRAAELAQLDPSNRALRQRIYALTDEQAATQAATQAAEAAAAAQKAIADERAGLERQILELNGDTAAIRALDLAKINTSNQALQLNVWALQDQAAATAAATLAAEAAAAAQKAISDEQAGLARQLLEAQGDTAAIRAATLAGLLSDDARATQQMIWNIQDQQAAEAVAQQQAEAAQQAAEQAAQAAKQLADAWGQIGDSIMDEVKRIRGLLDVTGGQSYASLLGQFNAATDAARGGDQDAAKSLPELSKALLDAAAAVATSRQELARVQGITAGSLEQTYALITAVTGASAASGGLPTVAVSADDSASTWWAAAAAQAGAGAGANDNAAEMRGLRADLQATKDELIDALAQVAAFGRRAAVVLESVRDQGEGDGFAVRAADGATVKVAA